MHGGVGECSVGWSGRARATAAIGLPLRTSGSLGGTRLWRRPEGDERAVAAARGRSKSDGSIAAAPPPPPPGESEARDVRACARRAV